MTDESEKLEPRTKDSLISCGDSHVVETLDIVPTIIGDMLKRDHATQLTTFELVSELANPLSINSELLKACAGEARAPEKHRT